MSQLEPSGSSLLAWRLLFWAAVVGAFVLALWPEVNPQEPLFAGIDKVKHATAFAVLAIIGLRAGYRSLIGLAVGLLILGAAVEVAQGAFTTTRTADVLDWLADAAGIAIGLGLWSALLAPRRRSVGLEQEHGG